MNTLANKWTPADVEKALKLRAKGLTNPQIAKTLKRTTIAVELKLKRLQKKKGKKYNQEHRENKYKTNQEFLDLIKPTTVLDVYSGEQSFYKSKCPELTTNDKNQNFDCDFNLDAHKLCCLLTYQGKKFDLVDLDPFGSAFDCIDLSIKMAKKGLIITFGEMGHKRFKRLDFVSSRYNINSLEQFTTQNLISQVQTIGRRNKKHLSPVIVKHYRNIARVYFQISPLKIPVKKR